MKLEAQRGHIDIVPENDMERAYLEVIIGMAAGGPGATVERVTHHALSSLCRLEVRPKTTVTEEE